MFSISLGGRKRICNRGPDRNYHTRHQHQDHRPLRITRNRGERGCVNQVNVINQEIVIHQRVENQTNINLSKSKNIISIDNDEIDKGWNGLKSQEQRNLVRRHIVSDSSRPRNSNVVEVTKSKTTSNPKLVIKPTDKKIEEGRVSNIIVPTAPGNKSTLNNVAQKEKDQTSRITLQERKRRAITQKKTEEKKTNQARDTQKQPEDQRARITLQERKRTELAQRKVQEEKIRRTRAVQSQQAIINSKTRNLSKPLPVRQTSKSQPSSNSRSFSRNIPNKETSRRVVQQPTPKKTTKTFSRSIQK